MAGVQLHPAVRALIGAGLVGFGLARHDAIAPLLIGAALIVWGVAATAERLWRE